MNNINSVVLAGRLTKDAIVTSFKNSDNKKFSFRIAVNKSVKKNGKWEDYANFFEVEAWNIDYLKEALTKGRQVVVSGQLDSSSWKDSDGNDRSKIFVNADRVQVFHSDEKKEAPKKTEEPSFDPEWDDIP